MGKSNVRRKSLKKLTHKDRFMTRSRALKKLQVSLKEFKRLCILKGIYPRDPHKKRRGHDKIYYLAKDIRFLAADPLVHGMRAYAAHLKRINVAKSRKEIGRMKRLQLATPKLSLVHVFRERYPTFEDSLVDLDDALTILNMFIRFPPSKDTLSAEARDHSLRLVREFQTYTIMTHGLRKVFVSVKGIYYQADVMGRRVTWIEPHHYFQEAAGNVDNSVLKSFLSYYRMLCGFVFFKLFHTLGVHYPLSINNKRSFAGQLLGSVDVQVKGGDHIKVEESGLNIDKALKVIDSYVLEQDGNQIVYDIDGPNPRGEEVSDDEMEVDEEEDSDDDVEMDEDDDPSSDSEEELVEMESATTEDALPEVGHIAGHMRPEDRVEYEKLKRQHRQIATLQRLFEGEHVWLGRETPLGSLEFVIRSLGGKVSWYQCGNGAEVDDKDITLEVVDRLQLPSYASKFPERRFVQPQWVYDSVNACMQLPVEEYAIGKALPPHLSPFVEDTEGYIPERRQQILRLMREAAYLDEEEKEEEEKEDDRLERLQQQREAEIAKEHSSKEKSGEAGSMSAQRQMKRKREEEEDIEKRELLLRGNKRTKYKYLKKEEDAKEKEVALLKEKKKAIDKKKAKK